MNKSLLLLLLTVLSLLLRFYHLGHFGFWYDEEETMLVANGQVVSEPLHTFNSQELDLQNDLGHVIQATIEDNGNSVAYNVLLHSWLKCFGNSEISARSLSVIFGLLLIPLVFIFSKRLFDNARIAWIAAFLTAMHPLFVAFAHQSRTYTMATFFTLLASYFFFDIVRGNGNRVKYSGYVIAVVISFLSHYLTVYVFIAHAIIFCQFTPKWKTWLSYGISGSVILLLIAAWMFNGGLQGMEVLDTQNARYMAVAAQNNPEENFALPATVKNILTGSMQVWLQVFGNQFQNFGLRIREIGIMFLLPLTLLAFLSWRKRKERHLVKLFSALGIIVIVQILFAIFLAVQSGHCISFQPLYANFAVPYAIVLMAAGLNAMLEQERLKKLGIGYIAAIAGIMLVSCWPVYFIPAKFPEVNNEYKAAEEIIGRYPGIRSVVIRSDREARLINLYIPSNLNIPMEVDTVLIDQYMIK